MGLDSAISWTHDTVNPWWGCTRVSPGCRYCYAERWARRTGLAWGKAADRRIRVDAALRDLRASARRAERTGERRRVFIASMADVFETRPDLDAPRDAFLAGLRALGPDAGVDPLVLTKRPDRMAAWAESHGWPDWWWAGTTVEDQPRAHWRIPDLLRVPARVRWLSCEPLLGPVSIWRNHSGVPVQAVQGVSYPPLGLWWCIVGGESGPHARPMLQTWAEDLVAECHAAGAACWVKQLGGHPDPRRDPEVWPAPLRVQQLPIAPALALGRNP